MIRSHSRRRSINLDELLRRISRQNSRTSLYIHCILYLLNIYILFLENILTFKMSTAGVLEDSGEVTFNIRDHDSQHAEASLEPESSSHPVREQSFHTGEGMSGRNGSRYVPSDQEDISLRQKVDGVTEALADMAKALKLLTESQAHRQLAMPGNQVNNNQNCFSPRRYENDRAVDVDRMRVNWGYNPSLPQRACTNQGPADLNPNSNDYEDDQDTINESPSTLWRGQPRRLGEEPYGYQELRVPTRRQRVNVKIAPFTGKEDWAVWMARFEAIAQRNGWSSDDRLDQLLPRMEDQAGQFVFTQLPHGTLNNYVELMNELNSRFRVIETPRAYAAKFSRRIQREGETAEEFAADLKRLYDKAHGYRDRKTREEDLMRKFQMVYTMKTFASR